MRGPFRPPPPAAAIITGLYAVRWSTPQLVTPGDAMRAAPCLACGHAIGGEAALTACLTHYVPPGPGAGDLPSTAWLLHASHRGISTRAVHDLAQWRLGTHNTR